MGHGKKLLEALIRYQINESKYLNPVYRRAMDIYDVPVDFMWTYREFDRCGEDNLYGDDYIERLTSDIKENGIEKPIVLQIDSNTALITEGNHRLCIAIKLNMKTIPVMVVHRPFGSINRHKAKPIKYASHKWRAGLWDW
jgi:hypothetical protein